MSRRKPFDLYVTRELPIKTFQGSLAKKLPRDFQIRSNGFRILVSRSKIKDREFTVTVKVHTDFLSQPFSKLLDRLSEQSKYLEFLPSPEFPFGAMGSNLFIVGISSDKSWYADQDIDINMDKFNPGSPLCHWRYSHVSYDRFMDFIVLMHALLSTYEGAWAAYKNGGIIQRDLKTENCNEYTLRLLVIFLATKLSKSASEIQDNFSIIDVDFTIDDLSYLLKVASDCFE